MAESETPLTGHRSVTRRLTGHSGQQTSMRFALGSTFALKSVAIALVFLITVVFLIALFFLIAGLGPALAEVEDFRQPAGDLAQGPGLLHDGDAFGIKGSPWRGNFMSLSVGGKAVPSLGDADLGAPPAWQGELNADYSSSTLDGGLFPATATDSRSVDALIMNDPVIFGDSDHGGGFGFGFFVRAPSAWFGLPNVDPSPDRTRKGGSHCESDGSTSSVIRCEIEEGAQGAGSDAGYSPAQQGSPFDRAYLPQQISGLGMTAQNNFTIISAGDATQGTRPPVADTLARVPAFASTTSDLASGPLSVATLGDSIGIQPAAAVPEIPIWAMLLGGFSLMGAASLFRPRRRDPVGVVFGE
jgi:hypothetical protein